MTISRILTVGLMLALQCLNSVLNVKVLVAAFEKEKALVGAFSVITNLRVDLRLKSAGTLSTLCQ